MRDLIDRFGLKPAVELLAPEALLLFVADELLPFPWPPTTATEVFDP